MEILKTISDELAVVSLELIEKVELGGGLEGYYIVKTLMGNGSGGWVDRELAVFDEHFYTNTDFLRKGFKVKGALYHLGGYTGELAKERIKVFDHRVQDRSWEGYELQGPIVHEAYLGHVLDVGIPIHCHFTFSSNLPLVKKWKKEGVSPNAEGFELQKKGDWVHVVGGLYILMLKELILVCTSCNDRKKYLTTTLPTMDELTSMHSVCRRCKNEQESNALPDICNKCKKKMWQWKGEDVEFPLDCDCGNNRYDFFFDHKPMFVI